MKNWVLVAFFMCLCLINGRTQGVVVNFDLDTTSWQIRKPLKLWLDFLGTKKDSLGSFYWNKTEVESYGSKNYFGLKREQDFGQPDYLAFISYGNMRVMSIRKRGEYFKISNMLSFTNAEGSQDVYFLFHVYAGMEEGQLKLFNALHINRELLLAHKKVGFINYYFPQTHDFNRGLAEKQNDFLVDLAKNFEVPLVEVDYYFAETTEEIQKIKGFDFIYGDNGESMPTGVSYVFQREIFTNGSGEYYPHEIIHVLLNPHFPRSHYWINEGIATYFGMSRGKELGWHLRKLKSHLEAHPEIDLGDMLSLVRIDGSTGYSYVLGGYIVQLIYEKDGYAGLKEAMNAGRSEEDFYRIIKRQLGIKRKNVNAAFRTHISMLFED